MKRLNFQVRPGDMLQNVSETQTPSERAILWFLRAYELEHQRGATKEEVQLYAGISDRNFARAWPRLERAGLVRVELRLTERGRAEPMQKAGSQ